MATVAALIATAFALTTLPAFAQGADKAAPMTPEAAGLKKMLEQKFPGAEIRRVVKTPYFGLYEVMLDDRIVYATKAGGWVNPQVLLSPAGFTRGRVMFARLLLQLVLAAFAASPAFAQGQPSGLAKATFAAGCFWCTEEAMDKVPGVNSTTSGYIGGHTKRPTYEQVSSGITGHTEVVEVTYDLSKVSYERLLEQFWVNHDPTVIDGQFCDKGSQYRPEIFYHSAEQKRLAEASKAKWEKDKPFKQPMLTPITPAGEFWPAEDYHQDYYKKNPLQYNFYVTGCGRYKRLDQLWGKLRK